MTLAAAIAEIGAMVGFVLWVHWLSYRPAPAGEYEGQVAITGRCEPCCAYSWQAGRWRPSCGRIVRTERDRLDRLVSVPADRWPELATAPGW